MIWGDWIEVGWVKKRGLNGQEGITQSYTTRSRSLQKSNCARIDNARAYLPLYLTFNHPFNRAFPPAGLSDVARWL